VCRESPDPLNQIELSLGVSAIIIVHRCESKLGNATSFSVREALLSLSITAYTAVIESVIRVDEISCKRNQFTCTDDAASHIQFMCAEQLLEDE
jgi:hypothetical protein